MLERPSTAPATQFISTRAGWLGARPVRCSPRGRPSPSAARSISVELARRLIAERERLGGFGSWDEVDAVEGVGTVRLTSLQERCQLPPGDGGV